jgi:molybdopterin-containing oxidoreductase family membrane subunit
VNAILEKYRISPPYTLWLGFLCAVLILGAYVTAVRFLGHEEVFGATDLVPLGILISTYVFFVVTSTGLCFITSFGHVFGLHRYELIARRGVFLSIITLLAGFLAIGLETERPWRLGALFIVSPNFTAPIWWMAFFYNLYLIFLVIEFCGLIFGRSLLARYAGLIGFLTAIAAHSTLGAIFGVLKAKPFWEGPFLPIYFILSALVSGTAFLILMTIATYRLEKRSIPPDLEALLIDMGRKLLAFFLGIVLFFWAWKVITSLYGHPPGKYEAIMSLLAGPLSLRFWLFEIGIGLLIPFTFLLFVPKARSTRGVFFASLLVLIGLFVSRFDLVVAGQIVPVWGGPHASYAPTLIEWIIVASCLALCLLIYSIGERLLPLEETMSSETIQEKAQVKPEVPEDKQ